MNFVFRDNITGHGNYGIHGLSDVRSAAAQAMFTNNVFINIARVPSGDYAFPPGNTIVNDLKDVGFADAGDYRLAPTSRFKGKGSGGKNIGSDLSVTAFLQN